MKLHRGLSKVKHKDIKLVGNVKRSLDSLRLVKIAKWKPSKHRKKPDVV